jgi:hypothetical protein
MRILIDGQEKAVTCKGNKMKVWGKDLKGRTCIVSEHSFAYPADSFVKMLTGGSIRTNGHKYERV